MHHAALFLVPPSPRRRWSVTMRKDGAGRASVGPLPGTALLGLSADPLLTFWAPGQGAGRLPEGHRCPPGRREPGHHAGPLQPPLGNKPVRDSLVLRTVPASTPLLPLHLDLMLAPPNIPCPAGVTGPRCNRAAALANLGQRFGRVGRRGGGRHRRPSAGRTRPIHRKGIRHRAVSPIAEKGYIVRVYVDMHLLGRAFADGAEPGDAEGPGPCSTWRTTTSTTRSRTTWPSPFRSPLASR